METKYLFKTPSLWKGASADKAAEELERIRRVNGILTPELVVNESAAESAVLHKCFQWNDTIAAEKYRISQAQDLIRNLTVVVVNESINCSVRALVNVTNKFSCGKRSYIPIAEAIVDEDAYADLLAQAKAEMESFVSKYSQLSELNSVKAEMLKTISEL